MSASHTQLFMHRRATCEGLSHGACWQLPEEARPPSPTSPTALLAIMCLASAWLQQVPGLARPRSSAQGTARGLSASLQPSLLGTFAGKDMPVVSGSHLVQYRGQGCLLWPTISAFGPQSSAAASWFEGTGPHVGSTSTSYRGSWALGDQATFLSGSSWQL